MQPCPYYVLCIIQIILLIWRKRRWLFPLNLIGSPIICGTRTTALKHRKRKMSGFIPTVLRGKQAETKEESVLREVEFKLKAHIPLNPWGSLNMQHASPQTKTHTVWCPMWQTHTHLLPTSKGRRWRWKHSGCWRAGCGRCRPRTFAIYCKDHPCSPDRWWLAVPGLTERVRHREGERADNVKRGEM